MAWYDNGEKGMVGQIANLTSKRVESFPAGGSIKAGSLVKLDTTKSKVVQLNKSADKGAILGVAFRKIKKFMKMVIIIMQVILLQY